MMFTIDPELRQRIYFRAPMSGVFLHLGRFFLNLLPRRYDRKRLKVRKLKGRCFVLTPKDKADDNPLPCLFYIHGGGLVYPSSPFIRKLVSEYAAEAGIAVVDLEYPLCPKHAYPDAPSSIASAISHVLFFAKEYGIDPARIALGGDSAGGLLALEAQLALEKSRTPKPRALMLVYPVTDHRMQTESMRVFGDTPGWDGVRNAIMWKYYLKGQDYVSPLERADSIHVDRLYVELCQIDCLHGEGYALYDALKDRVGEAVLNDTEGTYHAYDVHRKAAVTKASVAARIAFLRGLHDL